MTHPAFSFKRFALAAVVNRLHEGLVARAETDLLQSPRREESNFNLD